MPGDQHQQTQRKHRFTISRSTRGIALLLCLGTLAGVLIWAKLRLVTDIPRSAYADPKERQADGGDPAGDGESAVAGRESDAAEHAGDGSVDGPGSPSEHP